MSNGGAVSKIYVEVPELVLGFDTETTGLATSSERAISYGFCLYRGGVLEWTDHLSLIHI